MRLKFKIVNAIHTHLYVTGSGVDIHLTKTPNAEQVRVMEMKTPYMTAKELNPLLETVLVNFEIMQERRIYEIDLDI